MDLLWCNRTEPLDNMIRNFYFREDLLDKSVSMVPTTDDRLMVGPIVVALVLAGGSDLGLQGNLGPAPAMRGGHHM